VDFFDFDDDRWFGVFAEQVMPHFA
jgi:hypothetical protein